MTLSATFEIAAAILISLYVAVIARQVVVRGPTLSVLFMIGGGAMVAFGVLTPEEALHSIDFSVIVFLFSMFVFAVALERAGVLAHLANWLLGLGRKPESMPFYLFIGFGLLSAILVNDAFILLSVPLILSLARSSGTSPKPLLLTMAYAVTVGSVMTPIGNPQNALIALSSGITAPFTTFAVYLVIPTVANLIVCGMLVKYWFGSELARARAMASPDGKTPVVSLIPPVPAGGWLRFFRLRPSVTIFPGTVALLIMSDVGAAVWHIPEIPIWAVSLGGALLVLALQPTGRNLLEDVNWDTLLLFVGLFVVMGGVSYGHLFSSLGQVIPTPNASGGGSTVALASVTLSSLFGSQLLSNIPWTALTIPFLQGLGYGAATPRVWMALAAATTLAGNLTLLGAASNLIMVTQAERAGIKVTFMDFARYGVPITFITIGIAFAAIIMGI